MNKSITDFVEDYIDGEPLTTKTVEYAIKKYLYINFAPSKQERLEMYEAYLWALASAMEFGDGKNLDRLINNVKNWAKANSSVSKLSEEEQASLKNETFYTLCNLD